MTISKQLNDQIHAIADCAKKELDEAYKRGFAAGMVRREIDRLDDCLWSYGSHTGENDRLRKQNVVQADTIKGLEATNAQLMEQVRVMEKRKEPAVAAVYRYTLVANGWFPIPVEDLTLDVVTRNAAGDYVVFVK